MSNNTVDLVLVLDGSGSIGDETFQLQLGFAAQLAHRLNVSTGTSHMAIIQYAESPQLEISLNQYMHPNQVRSLRQSGSSSGAMFVKSERLSGEYISIKWTMRNLIFTRGKESFALLD